MKRTIALVSAAALVLLTAACGDSKLDRGVTGGAIGAAAGATLGAVTVLPIGIAALVGAGIGGAVGLVTDKSVLNIGDPFWE